MAYDLSIIHYPLSKKKFIKIDKESALRIKKDIEKLSFNPRPVACIKLNDRKGWRIRSGNYRVIYEIFDNEKRINILHAGHRKDVYK